MNKKILPRAAVEMSYPEVFLGLSKNSLEKGLSGTARVEVVLSWEGVAGEPSLRALPALTSLSFCKKTSPRAKHCM